jgi:hypothetical protein
MWPNRYKIWSLKQLILMVPYPQCSSYYTFRKCSGLLHLCKLFITQVDLYKHHSPIMVTWWIRAHDSFVQIARCLSEGKTEGRWQKQVPHIRTKSQLERSASLSNLRSYMLLFHAVFLVGTQVAGTPKNLSQLGVEFSPIVHGSLSRCQCQKINENLSRCISPNPNWDPLDVLSSQFRSNLVHKWTYYY